MACPSGLTTRPSVAFPTGTSTTRPVRFARSPSLTRRDSPNNTKPTLSASRFNAIPKTPFGNSTSSELITFSNPLTRATPSPTSKTSPTSDTSTERSNLAICSLNRAVILSVLISMVSFFILLIMNGAYFPIDSGWMRPKMYFQHVV